MIVYHIHTDLKFISGTARFEGKYFENQIIIIGDSNDYNGSYKNNARWFNSSRESVLKIIEICTNADLVVLYDLDFIKCKIALGLPARTKIAWRFFGYELYNREAKLYSSTLTQQSLRLNKTQLIKKILPHIVNAIRSHLKWGFYPNANFAKAVNRINFFLGLSQEEYNYLLTRWPDLPAFVKLPVFLSDLSPEIISEFYLKEKSIIVGNSRSFLNNNLDVIDIIDSSEKHNQYQFVLLFNYGMESNYSYKIRDAVRGKKYYKVINDFMTLDKLDNLYQIASAAIFNVYRQMALGNIFIALRSGVKLYLSNKNIITQWLRKEGFIIYSIDDLAKDLDSDNISLSIDEAKYNAEQLRKMVKAYTTDDFQRTLYSLIKDNTIDLS